MIATKSDVQEMMIADLPVVMINGIDRFDVSKTFDCGQAFRFDRVSASRHENEFAGCAHGKYISFAQDGDTLYIYNATAKDYYEIWEHYLALDRDYAEIDREILAMSDNPTLKEALDASSGIRILRQEPWEAVCSFIISQNNNIPRIKKIVADLCSRCGERADTSKMQGHIADLHNEREGNFYSFPSPERVRELGVDGLFDLKTGFRAKYLYDAANRIANNEISLSSLEFLDSTSECAETLTKIKGVGPKVAACALLFGFGKLDAFPIDVWIRRVLDEFYPDGLDIAALGDRAGIAQQYLFYYKRYLKGE